MRRKDREVTDIHEIKKILAKSEVMRIALNNGIYPYVIPVNFGFEFNDDKLMLFFHGAKDGKKHEVIKQDNHTTFEIDCGHMLMPPVGDEPCTASYAYESVIGHGIIEVADESEKEYLLKKLLQKYDIEVKHFNPEHLSNTVIYKIFSESYTAKCRKNDR